jgi:nanoRNase/pAp phosphatase (c-di-AMP/oligoRNAs hydrolase)
MRLLTRSDFDGLICAVLLQEAGIMDDWKFVHPKDLQDGHIKVTANDILANVPYTPGCGIWFDHHSSEQQRLSQDLKFDGASRNAPSCARVIWEYYGGHDTFPERFDDMMRYVDKVDSADLTIEEIEEPDGWVLLGFIMDPRTGLGRFRDYSISNYQLMDELIGFCRTLSIADILELPDVRERVQRYFEQQALFKEMLRENCTVQDNVVVLDLRDQELIYSGNRFIIYTMFPQCNVSVQVIWGLKKQNTVFTVGHSVVNRGCKTNIGQLMLTYGGGGHDAVGTCQVPHDKAEAALADIVRTLRKNG